MDDITGNAEFTDNYELLELDAALKRLGGSDALLREFANIFLEDGPLLKEKIGLAIETQSGSELRSSAHAIKGLISNFGAVRCVEKARALEVAGAEKDFPKASQEFPLFTRQYELLKAELTRFLDSGLATDTPAD